MRLCVHRAVLALAALPAALAAADPVLMYSTDFESGALGSEWSQKRSLESGAAFTTFNGRCSWSEGIALDLPAAPKPKGPGEHIRYTALFDFYCIDSWDGNDTGYGQDWLVVNTSGGLVLADTFANQPGDTQTFREPDVGRADMGFMQWQDAIYRDVELTWVGNDDPTIWIWWRSENLQGLIDESWGIDNVRVSYEVIPAPASATLLGLAGLAAARRRR